MTDIRIINITDLNGIWTDLLLKPNGSLDAGLHFKYDLKTNKEG